MSGAEAGKVGMAGTGMAGTAGVIGWPVAHSKSPVIHRFWLEALGLDGDYGRFPVAPERLAAAIGVLPALGLRGVNVTVPHKERVMPLLDEIDPLARKVGAVNTIVVGEGGRLAGFNTDVAGFAEKLPERIGHAVVIGAGGAARAVLVALQAHGVADVVVMNRTVEKAERLLDELGLKGKAVAPGRVPATDLLVNATSLGMAGQPPLDVDISALPEGACVYDIVYVPLETALLKAARARGLVAIDGLDMLIGQADHGFRHFFGAVPPREHDGALRQRLTGAGG